MLNRINNLILNILAFLLGSMIILTMSPLIILYSAYVYQMPKKTDG